MRRKTPNSLVFWQNSHQKAHFSLARACGAREQHLFFLWVAAREKCMFVYTLIMERFQKQATNHFPNARIVIFQYNSHQKAQTFLARAFDAREHRFYMLSRHLFVYGSG